MWLCGIIKIVSYLQKNLSHCEVFIQFGTHSPPFLQWIPTEAQSKDPLILAG